LEWVIVATRTAEVIVYSCDNCGHEETVDIDGDLPPGFVGEVWGDVEKSSWYACKVSCIKKAVINALENI
jgi:hypothetical protein